MRANWQLCTKKWPAFGHYPLGRMLSREHSDAREACDDPSFAARLQFPAAARNRAMPLPVAGEGIAGLLQRSENRRNSVSPNNSPGTAKRNPAMPLPVADEGIAGLLQRSENRRSSVSPNDSPGTAKRVAEGEWLSSPFRGCVYVTLLSCRHFLRAFRSILSMALRSSLTAE